MNKLTTTTALLVLLWIPVPVFTQSIVSSTHNLSVSGPGTVKASSETEICVFCHTPHNSRPVAPLWNRNDPGATYILYNSSTTQAGMNQPDGSSILCLSCHDGTIALGNVLSRTTPIAFASGVTTMPVGSANLATDLANDHPVSFLYNAALMTADGELKNPSTLTGPVKLENGKLQCTSCHDPHKNLTSDFLVATTQNSNLCLNCHQKNYWSTTTHNTSTKTWNNTAPDPWPHTTWTTVAQNACENCHNPHNAGGKPRLLNSSTEETNCYTCHNSNVATKNIQALFAKANKHNIAGYTGIHDPTEATMPAVKHVECVDCHNAHASDNTTAVAPNVSGRLKGLKGINQSGANVFPAQYEYEICYRCHTSNSWAPTSTPRVVNSFDCRIDFATTNASFHPVVGPRNNAEIAGNLVTPNTASTVIYCSACHASDGAGAPAGPHGSLYPRILVKQYVMTDPNNVGTSAGAVTAYALCFTCHSSSVILNTGGANSFRYHFKHIVEERTPCNTCHDAHGIGSPGTATSSSNLMNFNTSIVTKSGTHVIEFVDTGLRRGTCWLTCHSKNHNGWTYN